MNHFNLLIFSIALKSYSYYRDPIIEKFEIYDWRAPHNGDRSTICRFKNLHLESSNAIMSQYNKILTIRILRVIY